MIALKDIQQTARDLIKAGPSDDTTYFADETVVVDVGLSRDDIENALATRGFCVAVNVPLMASIYQNSPGGTLLDVVIPIDVQVNPTVNAEDGTGAQKNILEALGNIFTALREYAENDEADRFELLEGDQGGYQLVTLDSGLLMYVMLFKKLCAQSTKN